MKLFILIPSAVFITGCSSTPKTEYVHTVSSCPVVYQYNKETLKENEYTVEVTQDGNVLMTNSEFSKLVTDYRTAKNKYNSLTILVNEFNTKVKSRNSQVK